MNNTKKIRGQFFTKNEKVHKIMNSLFQTSNGSRILEPSAGAGDLVKLVESRPGVVIDAVELDSTLSSVCTTQKIYSDFFTYALDRDNTYNGIIGNPPYVAWKELEKATKDSAAATKKPYSDKCNLYYLFMDRCIDLLVSGGELVFIVPKEWLYTSSAVPLRKKIVATGHITHIVDCGEDKLFADADVPALLIFRFVKTRLKNNSTYSLSYAGSTDAALANKYVDYVFSETNACFVLLPHEYDSIIKTWGRLGDHFDVKVGMVSGADQIFRVQEGMDLESSCVQKYLTTKGIEEFIDVNDYSQFSDIPVKTRTYLLQHKNTLLSRRIDSFDESNWWKYGAVRNKKLMLSKTKRFYCYVKTRKPEPFFTHNNASLYSGGILGLFSKSEKLDVSIEDALRLLNSKKYRKVFEAMFLATGNKLSLQPSTLSNMLFPKTSQELEDWLE